MVVVSADYADTYALPVAATVEKTLDNGAKKGNSIELGSQRHWFFDKKSGLHQLLELVETDAKRSVIMNRIKTYTGIPSDEFGVDVKISQYETIYKVRVADTNSRHTFDEEDTSTVTLDLYTFERLNVGAEYELTYFILPHPTKNQKLTAVATHVIQLDNEDDFIVDRKLLAPLMSSGSISDRVDRLYQSAKHHIAKTFEF